MIYQEYGCDQNISKQVLCYWKFTVPPNESGAPFPHFVLADGCPSLAFFSLPQYHVQSRSLVGPTKRIHERPVHPGSTVIGIRFRPGVISSLCGISGLELRDQNISPAPAFIDIDEAALWEANAESDALWVELLNKQLLAAELSQAPVEPLVLELANAIQVAKGNVSISDLVEAAPKSERQLQKLFKKEVGLTMKEFAITMRVRASVIELEQHKSQYQDAVHAQGYFDQAHFIRDFTKLSSISLPDFKRYVQAIEHIGVDYRC